VTAPVEELYRAGGLAGEYAACCSTRYSKASARWRTWAGYAADRFPIVSIQLYSVGKTSSVSNVDVTKPPMTTVASGRCTSAPAPVEIAIGMNPTLATSAGIQTADGDYVSIDFPGATATRAFGINARGDVVGSYVAAGQTFGFLARRTH
jgi:hypothetical protein